MVTHKMGQVILKDNPHVDHHWYYWENMTLSDHSQFFSKLRQFHYTHCLDFMDNPRSAFISLMSRSQHRIGFLNSRFFAYHTKIPLEKGLRYIVSQKADFLKALQIPFREEKIVFPWFPTDFAAARKFYPQDSKYRYILSPTHRRPLRRWSSTHFAQLSDYITESKNAHVIWNYGPGEQDFVQEIRRMCRKPSLLAPETTLRENAALIANADCFISTSNGPSHLAVANDTCSLQLHGPTTAHSWCPMTERHTALQAPGIINEKTDLSGISFDSVIEAVDRLEHQIQRGYEARKQHQAFEDWQQAQNKFPCPLN